MANRLFENMKIGGGIAPQSVASATVTSPFVCLSEFRQALFVLIVGAIAAGKNVTLKVVQAKDALGTDKKDVEGAILGLTEGEAGGFLEMKSGDLDRNNGYTHVSIEVTTDATILVAVNQLLGSARFTPKQDLKCKVVGR